MFLVEKLTLPSNSITNPSILWFINSLAKTWNWANGSPASYQHLERIIRTEVPDSVRTHFEIKEWIATRMTQYSFAVTQERNAVNTNSCLQILFPSASYKDVMKLILNI
ncbi:hypothetical protein QF042_000431 [Pedobacter sp. W3I1]|nr:hypothetical protein [Pedobacter sp. W3I1]